MPHFEKLGHVLDRKGCLGSIGGRGHSEAREDGRMTSGFMLFPGCDVEEGKRSDLLSLGGPNWQPWLS